MLTFRFTGADGSMVQKETLTAGMVKKKVKLEFSGDWNNMTKIAVFTAGSVTRSVVGVTDEAVIPAEVLAVPLKKLYLGIYGVSADGTVTPTIRVKGPMIQPGTAPSHDEGSDPDLEIWAQLQQEISALKELGAAGEDGGYYIPVVTQTAANTVQISFEPSMETMPEIGAVTINIPGADADWNENSGLNGTASALLISILRNGVYSTDQSAAITALENALLSGGTGGEEEPDTPIEPDEPVVTTYTVVSALLHATSDNASATVESGASYNATITAEDGYTLDGATVSVTMGGVDITATAYANGVVNIAGVTGNVIITVTAVAVVPSDILYQLESPVVCTADGSDPYDTGVKISDTDKDFTFCAIVTCDVQAGLALALGDCGADGLYGSGFNITCGSTISQMFRLYAEGGNTAFLGDWRASGEGRNIFVVTHTAGSGEYVMKMAYPTVAGKESNSPSTTTRTASFIADSVADNTVKIFKNKFVGTVNDLVIYNRVLTDDEITAYLEVE